jgi:alpha-L-arabinofuranosidase
MRKGNSFCAWLLLGSGILLVAGSRHVLSKPISEGTGSSDANNVTRKASLIVHASQRSEYPIDSVAALDRKGDLLISVVHRGISRPVQLSITFEGFEPEPQAHVRTLVADIPWAANSLDNPEVVKPVVATVKLKGRGLSLTLRPYSFICVCISRNL